LNKEQKTAVVEELRRELSEADAILAVDYRGISVPQAAELRSGLREADTRFRVVKNRLTLRAADAAGAGSLKEHLSGPTALALVKGDVALAANTISRLGSEWELLTYKGGLMDGEELDGDSFKQIARLPGRDTLNAQFAGIVASPLTGLVRGLGSMVQGLASQLQQIADQGLVSGEAPAPETPDSDQAPAEGDQGASEEGDDAEQPPGEDEEAGGEQGGEEERGAEASAEGEASAEPGEESSSDSEEEESPADPDPKQSPEETTAEEPGPGEEVPSEEVKPPEETGAPVGEGDAEIGSARGEEPADADTAEQEDSSEDDGATQEETSEDSDEDKEDQD
jgi:large subunit ribosomal protein L10